MTNVDLPYKLGFRDYFWSSVCGAVLVIGYFIAGTFAMYGLILWYKGREFMQRWGMPRFMTTSFLFLNMLAVVIKMLMRHAGNIKYVWVTPWINF
jgi:hypothetical protein